MTKIFISICAGLFFFSCNSGHQKLSQSEYDALTEEQKRSSEYALEGIDLMDKGLELTLFASEPMIHNPTNMDIDAKGRVWIVEGYNYRNKLNPKNDYDAKGDRILILEDTDGDGKADKSTVFYQGEDINSALGIGVFGNRVIVSRSPYVFVFTDEDGDDVPDKKEVLFEGIGGLEHDHGMHSFTFGPDGKFYFNHGNAGGGMLTKNGKVLYDKQGKPIRSDGKPYREGMVYRSDLDGSNVEALAWNFRNNYEVAVDSYGLMWQSDNDDDGNRGTRINYVMDYGNYGFKDEITGSDWRTRRVNMEDSIPLRHWHLNDPGVVPNVLQTYAGSPTGMIVYEGELLPKKYQNQMIHTDAGPNVVRSYPVEKQGAGYSAKILEILNGSKRDTWFRPSDLTVAPDGSLFIADWYDPGVGGHAVGDLNKGRIYRVAPKGNVYEVTKPKFESIDDNINALQSPNLATRYIAWNNLHDKGEEAEAGLKKLYGSENPRMKVRAFWLLSKLPKKGTDYIIAASKDKDENIRITAVRAARESKDDFTEMYLALAGDKAVQVRREVALAIRFKNKPEVWRKLANSYDGKDRWFLEALGISAEGQWDEYLTKYLADKIDTWKENKAVKDIVWRSRSTRTLDMLGQLIATEPLAEKWRYYRAMDFQGTGDKNSILFNLLAIAKDKEEKVVIFRQLDIKDLEKYPKLEEEMSTFLADVGPEDFLDLITKFQLKGQNERLLKVILENEDGRTVQQGAQTFIDFYGISEVQKLCKSENVEMAKKYTAKFGQVDSKEMTNVLIGLFQNKKLDLGLRKEAMIAMNGWDSESKLWELIKANKVPDDVMDIAKGHMMATWHQDIRAMASDFFGEDEATAEMDIKKMMAMNGDAKAGKQTFETLCSTCHLVKGKGVDFGPGLSEIGAKLSKEAIYNAILNPSAGMGFGYETQAIKLKDGTEIQAIINSKTENEINVKLLGQSNQTSYPLKDVASIKQLDVSLMPKFPFEEKQLVDLVSYLSSLK
jgi:putative membrane-bound dehydrogenase-like protein